jgi:hypothetical protein
MCGQENKEPKESVWHLVSHFFEDITHFDGKFFSTLKLLVIRPGFLPKEYMIGRRASYLNPVRMYVFTSAFFFLISFTFFRGEQGGTGESLKISDSSNINGKTMAAISKMDSATFADFTRGINRENGHEDVPMTRGQFKLYVDTLFKSEVLNIGRGKYHSIAEYDSLVRAGVIKHGWLTRKFIYKVFELKEKYNNDLNAVQKAIGENLLHSLPQMLFISLPLLALLLKLLYYRRRQFYYVNHAIFSIDLYIFVFITLLIIFSVDKLNGYLHWGVLTFFNTLLSLGMFFYTYKAMRKFYGQRRAKTIVKFLLLLFTFLILLLVLFASFILFSFFTI